MSDRGRQIHECLIQPGDTYGVSQMGNAFYVIKSTGTLKIGCVGQEACNYEEREGETFDGNFQYKRLDVFNPNSFAVTLRLWAGFGNFRNDKAFLADAPTEIVFGYNGTLANGAFEEFPGLSAGNLIQRQALIVSNFDASNAVEIRDADENILMYAFGKQNTLLQTSDYVKIHNASGSGVLLSVCEIWYVF